MMRYYAGYMTLSTAPFEGCIEITRQQFEDAEAAIFAGRIISVEGGQLSITDQEVIEPPPPDPQSRYVLATREFFRRFTDTEYAAARTSTNMSVQRALDDMIAAQFIDLRDPDLHAGLALFLAEGHIIEQRRDELLQPEPVPA